MVKIEIKEGDIVRYLIGYCVSVKKVYKDTRGLFIKECINTSSEYRRYINDLRNDLGFGIAEENELKYLED